MITFHNAIKARWQRLPTKTENRIKLNILEKLKKNISIFESVFNVI